jgi:acyl-CoA dehydrogenase
MKALGIEESVPPLRLKPTEFGDRAAAAAAIAKTYADAVDRQARFPKEAFEEIRRRRLLGIAMPRQLGGQAAGVSEILDVCYTLGQACSSTGMIYAMHQVKVACLVRHSNGSAALEAMLRRVAEEELLLSSSTTEGQAGGNIRSSEAPVQYDGKRIRLERRATCISYAQDADGIVTTARRTADAAHSDQVLLLFLKPDYTLEPLVGWDTLGMRGTCSEGFILRATGDAGNIVPESYDRIHANTMVPSAHLMWGAVWAGVAAAAVQRAQSFVRNAARQSEGRLPPGAGHMTSAVQSLQALLGTLAAGVHAYENIEHDSERLSSLEFQSQITLTKVNVSELAASTVLDALRACGLSGYRNDSQFSVTRHLRDVLSAPIMINNDRILANMATPAMVAPLPTSVGG